MKKEEKKKNNKKWFKKIANFFNNKRKYKTYSLFSVCIIGFICLLFGLVFGLLITYGKDTFTGKKISYPLQTFMSTYEDIIENYYGKIDEDKMIKSATYALMENLDQHSTYFDKNDSKDFQEEFDGSFVGIGVTVMFMEDSNSIIEVIPNSPAEKSGIKVGDQIIKVENKEVKDNSLVDLIRGKEGTKVNITVLREGNEIGYTLVRKRVEEVTVLGSIRDINNKKIGVITISKFSSNTYKQFNKELKKLEKDKIKGLVIDLRNNSGGQLTQANKILNLFFEKNTVLFKTKDKNNTVVYKDLSKEKRTYPVSILVNGCSASASEVIASSFKDSYKKGYIVGETTVGKGTVQQVKQLSNGTTIKYTSQKWFTSKNKNINGIGIEPDYKVNECNEDSDCQLDKALELVSK